uniref:Uncharacterized protein n=1 Tax=Candidatus Kentrum sp. UNK TaxID=2126344 RepID=A0A450ZXF6_9GAMM|nr:MAG: hypothetical protein BECKUNK1418G_GA0071005_100322 [Candidatus Kentron sp. UNK]VFK68875.1 MAG: hypothetical protein BECKUNK1418H_GA0071006_100723 [Candidatus Kentron sp. UNK]
MVIFPILQNQMLITFDFGVSLRHEILHFVQKSHFTNALPNSRRSFG